MGDRRPEKPRLHAACRPGLQFTDCQPGQKMRAGGRPRPGGGRRRGLRKADPRRGPAGPSPSEPRALSCPSGARERGESGEIHRRPTAAETGAQTDRAGDGPRRRRHAAEGGAHAATARPKAAKLPPPRQRGYQKMRSPPAYAPLVYKGAPGRGAPPQRGGQICGEGWGRQDPAPPPSAGGA